MRNAFIEEFMMYEQKMRFSDVVKKILKPKHYFYLTAQILTFVLLIIPKLLTITNWQPYNIIGFILLVPTVSAFSIEAYLILVAFDYYYVFPSLTDSEKDTFRQYYYNKKEKKEFKNADSDSNTKN